MSAKKRLSTVGTRKVAMKPGLLRQSPCSSRFASCTACTAKPADAFCSTIMPVRTSWPLSFARPSSAARLVLEAAVGRLVRSCAIFSSASLWTMKSAWSARLNSPGQARPQAARPLESCGGVPKKSASPLRSSMILSKEWKTWSG
eukprot:scaffold23122_cov62-Phaeocystis_antarctica.AAC.2